MVEFVRSVKDGERAFIWADIEDGVVASCCCGRLFASPVKYVVEFN
jgi:hypothetical protein